MNASASAGEYVNDVEVESWDELRSAESQSRPSPNTSPSQRPSSRRERYQYPRAIDNVSECVNASASEYGNDMEAKSQGEFVGLCNLPLVRIGNSHLGVAESSFVSQPVGVTFGNCGSIWDD